MESKSVDNCRNWLGNNQTISVEVGQKMLNQYVSVDVAHEMLNRPVEYWNWLNVDACENSELSH